MGMKNECYKASLKNINTQCGYAGQSKNDIPNHSISFLAYQKGPFGHFLGGFQQIMLEKKEIATFIA